MQIIVTEGLITKLSSILQLKGRNNDQRSRFSCLYINVTQQTIFKL